MQLNDLQRLDRLTQDLLDITKLESGIQPPQTSEIDPGLITEAALETVMPNIALKSIRIVTAINGKLPMVMADRGQMTRVLVNLLSNAIRHSPEGSQIEVDVSGVSLKGKPNIGDTVSDILAGKQSAAVDGRHKHLETPVFLLV